MCDFTCTPASVIDPVSGMEISDYLDGATLVKFSPTESAYGAIIQANIHKTQPPSTDPTRRLQRGVVFEGLREGTCVRKRA